VSVEPFVFFVGAVHDRVADPIPDADRTLIEKALRLRVALPSVTLMMMFPYVPTWLAVGVPESRPVVGLNVAQEGRFWMLKVSTSPSASVAEGWKLYASPVVTVVAGEPDIVGVLFEGALVTEIANAGNPSDKLPSLTRITMLLKLPVAVGVPERRPVVALKVAHDGLFWIVKASVSPSASAAEGWKL
jgi:hypothetical protein